LLDLLWGEVGASKLFFDGFGYLNANIDWLKAECGVAKKLRPKPCPERLELGLAFSA
jgi:hypothetical protein